MPRAVTAIARLVLAALIIAFGWHAARHPVDFHIYHGVGSQVLAGDYTLYPKGLYTALGPVKDLGFRYPPVLAVLFAPFALLPLPAAAFLFFILKVAALVAMTLMIVRTMGLPRSHLGTLIAVPLVATGGFMVEEFRNGNVHFVIVFLVVASMAFIERGRILPAAGLLALAIATKLTPALILVYWAVRRRFVACAATAACVVALGAAPALVVGWDANNRLLEGYRLAVAQTANQPGNFSLRGLVLSYFSANTHLRDPRYPDVHLLDLPRPIIEVLWVAAAAVIVAVIGFVLADRKNRTPTSTLIDYALLVTSMPILSPHTQRIHYAALLFPLAVLMALRINDAAGSARLITTAVAICVVAAAGIPLLAPGRQASLFYDALSPYVILAIYVAIVLAIVGTRLTREPDHAIPRSSRCRSTHEHEVK